MLSEQVLLDTPCEGGLKFNAKFTYLKIFDITWDFDLAAWYSHALKSQHKPSIANAIYTWITTRLWFSLPASICSPPWCWVSPVTRKEHVGWSQLKPIAFFEVNSVGCFILIFCVGLSHIDTVSMLDLAGIVWECCVLIIVGKDIYKTSWPTQRIEAFI